MMRLGIRKIQDSLLVIIMPLEQDHLYIPTTDQFGYDVSKNAMISQTIRKVPLSPPHLFHS